MISSPTTAPRLLWLGLGILAAGLALLAVLSRYTSMDTRVYQAVADLEVFDIGAVASEIALLGIAALWACCAFALLLRLLRRAVDAGPLARLIAGGVGSVLAYGASELFKSYFARVRPCHALDVMADCPAPDNWSYPSNHTVIAFSLAVAVVLAVPKTGYLVFPLALVVGVSRVVAGHHYPQDMMGGAVLGVGVAAASVLVLTPVARRALEHVRPNDAVDSEPRGRVMTIGTSQRPRQGK